MLKSSNLASVAALAALATTVTQLFYGLATGGFLAGSQLELVQAELKLIRKDLQSQFEIEQARNEVINFRLERLEQADQTRNSK